MIPRVDPRLADALGARRRDGRLRVLDERESPQRACVRVDGREFVNFTSNDYLGLAADPRVLDRVRDALPVYGFGAGAAALLSGRSALHAELEARLARFAGLPSAVLFTSGYLANLGALGTLLTRDTSVVHDRLNHASLIDAVLASGARHRRYAHADPDALADRLAATNGAAARTVVTESLFSMDGDVAPLARIAALADAHDALLYVDDAHGFGVLGDGRGALAALPAAHREGAVVMVTFGKALGSAGAAVLAGEEVAELLVQFARTFVYDTAAPPVCAAAALAALDALESDASPLPALVRNVARFRRGAAALRVPLADVDGPIQPVPVGEDGAAVAIAEAVCAAGYYVRAIRPPTVPAGTARLRVTLSAAHTDAQIDGLAQALAEAFEHRAPGMRPT